MSILWHLRETYRILSRAADAHKRLADSERESERDDRAMKNMAMAEAYDRSARLVGLVLQEAERRRFRRPAASMQLRRFKGGGHSALSG